MGLKSLVESEFHSWVDSADSDPDPNMNPTYPDSNRISDKPVAEAAREIKWQVPFPAYLDDEIAILKGMIYFECEKGPVKLNPNLIGDFHDFVENNLCFKVTSTQIAKKYSLIAAHAKSGKSWHEQC